MDLNEVSVFIKVVQVGSFSLAARQLGMPNSTVSSRVSSLEKRLGTTLIQRTTRRLNVTPAGQAYFARCIRGLEEIQGAEAELAATQGEPQGLLRVTAPVEIGSSVLPGIITDYSRTFPKVSVEVILTDRRVELLAENIDLAIRGGDLKDSTLIAKRLGAVHFAPFASPKYLRAAGALAHPRDLRNHECLHFTPLGFEEWTLLNSKGSLTIPVPSRIKINDLNMVKALAVNGSGIALLPTFHCGIDVRAGRLVRVLPEWRTRINPVHFVYPAQKYVTPKLSSFISFSAGRMTESLRDFDLD